MTTQVSLGISAKKMTKEEMDKRLEELRQQPVEQKEEKKEGDNADATD